LDGQKVQSNAVKLYSSYIGVTGYSLEMATQFTPDDLAIAAGEGNNELVRQILNEGHVHVNDQDDEVCVSLLLPHRTPQTQDTKMWGMDHGHATDL